MGLILKDEQFLPLAVAMVAQAQKSIDITTFKAEISHKGRGDKLRVFFDELIKKAKEGIKVRMLINWNSDKKSVAKTNLFVVQELRKHNVKIRYLDNCRCCHAKLINVDRKQVILGSHNLSIRSCANNFELSYLIVNFEDVKELANVFDSSFQDAKDF